MQIIIRLIILTFLWLIQTSQLKAQWVQTNGPYNVDGLTNIGVLSSDGQNLWAGEPYGDLQGGFVSTDNGENWKHLDILGTDVNYSVRAIVIEGKNTFALTYTIGSFLNTIYLSTDSGISWVKKNFTLQLGNINCLLADSTELVAGTTYSCYTSTNNGYFWDGSNLANIDITCLALSGTSLFAGTHGSGIFRSTDNGLNWAQMNNGLADSIIISLTANNSEILALTDSGIFRSTNIGASWAQMNNGLSSPFNIINDVILYENNIFEGTQAGLLLSTDQGLTWNFINNSDEFTYVGALAIDSMYIFAGTYGGGGWRRPLSEIITSVKAPSSNLPIKYNLEQNYPNPFNPTTTIKYSIPKESFITIKVYDITGRQIITLVNKWKSAGSYSLDFSASNLSSGIYFYRLVAGNFAQTRKMIFLK